VRFLLVPNLGFLQFLLHHLVHFQYIVVLFQVLVLVRVLVLVLVRVRVLVFDLFDLFDLFLILVLNFLLLQIRRWFEVYYVQVFHYVFVLPWIIIACRVLPREIARFLIVNSLIVTCFSNDLMVPVVFCSKSDTQCFLPVQVWDPVPEPDLLVKSKVDGEPECLIPAPDIPDGQVDPKGKAAEISRFKPAVKIPVGDLKERFWPDVPPFNHMDGYIHQDR